MARGVPQKGHRSPYGREHGAGIVLKRGRKRMVQHYHAASPSLRQTFAREVDGLPDIEAQPGSIGRLQELIEGCMEALDPFSRWLGRNPDGRGTLRVAALQPPELVDGSGGSGTAEVAGWLGQVLGDRRLAVTSPEPLLRWWGSDGGKGLRKADAVGMAQLLGKLGVGMEPDVRFGGPRPDKVKHVVLFQVDPEHPQAPSPAYTVAVLSTFFGAAAATADNVVAPEERALLEAQIQEADGLTDGDRRHLVAHLEWLLVERPSLAGLKKRLETVDAQRRSAIGHLLIRIVAADGRIEKAELTALAKLYRQLGLDPAAVHSDVHAFVAGGTPAAREPVTVRDPADAPGFAIPNPGTGRDEPPRPARPPVALDRSLLEAKLSESREAGRLLASIFDTEEDAVPGPAAESETDAVDLVEGLDLVHSRFVRKLAERELWSRADVEILMDTRKGLYSYAALQTRLAANTFAVGGLVDLSGPVLHLSNLTPEDLYVLLAKIRHVFAAGDPATYLVPDGALEQFLVHCSERIGDAYFRTPRNTVTAFVNLLAVLEQNPGASWQQLLGGVEIGTETNPDLAPLPELDVDEPAGSDDAGSTDDELASFRL